MNMEYKNGSNKNYLVSIVNHTVRWAGVIRLSIICFVLHQESVVLVTGRPAVGMKIKLCVSHRECF